MSAANPISIREYGARPHQRGQSDGRLRVFGLKDYENLDGVTVEHVRDGVALTPKGALLLRQYRERVS